MKFCDQIYRSIDFRIHADSSHLQMSRRRIVVLRKWRTAREMWTGTISVLSNYSPQSPRPLTWTPVWCTGEIVYGVHCFQGCYETNKSSFGTSIMLFSQSLVESPLTMRSRVGWQVRERTVSEWGKDDIAYCKFCTYPLGIGDSGECGRRSGIYLPTLFGLGSMLRRLAHEG